MKKLLMIVMLLISLLMMLSTGAFAGDVEKGFILSYPMETAVTAFYFPTDKTIAGGISETVVRIKYISAENSTLSKIYLDLDGTLAKEFTEAQDSLYGIGIKAKYGVHMTSKTGMAFEPSIGVTALRSLKGINKASDVARNYRLALYGDIVLYRF